MKCKHCDEPIQNLAAQTFYHTSSRFHDHVAEPPVESPAAATDKGAVTYRPSLVSHQWIIYEPDNERNTLAIATTEEYAKQIVEALNENARLSSSLAAATERTERAEERLANDEAAIAEISMITGAVIVGTDDAAHGRVGGASPLKVEKALGRRSLALEIAAIVDRLEESTYSRTGQPESCLLAALADARREALEEAAQLMDEIGATYEAVDGQEPMHGMMADVVSCHGAGDAIRGLILEPPSSPGGTEGEQ